MVSSKMFVPAGTQIDSNEPQYPFLDLMNAEELGQVLSLFFPIIKLDKKTYMLGVERKTIVAKDEKLFIKTPEGYITLESYIDIECIDGSLQIEKTIRDLRKPFKQVVVLHLRGHQAAKAIVSSYEATDSPDQELFLAVIARLRAEPGLLKAMKEGKGEKRKFAAQASRRDSEAELRSSRVYSTPRASSQKSIEPSPRARDQGRFSHPKNMTQLPRTLFSKVLIEDESPPTMPRKSFTEKKVELMATQPAGLTTSGLLSFQQIEEEETPRTAKKSFVGSMGGVSPTLKKMNAKALTSS